MPDSLVSGLSPAESGRLSGAVLAGIHYGALAMWHRQQQASANDRAYARIQAENDRQQQAFQQAWAMRSLELAQQAETVRRQTSNQYWTNKLKDYSSYVNGIQNYYADAVNNPSRYTPDVQDAAKANIQWAANKQRDLLGVNPLSADPVNGIPALNETPPSTAPLTYSPDYIKQQQQEDQDKADAAAQNLKNDQYRGALLGNKLSNPPITPDQKAQQQQAKAFSDNRSTFIGAVQDNNNASNAWNAGVRQYGDANTWRNTDPKGYAAAAKTVSDARDEYSSAAGKFLPMIENGSLIDPMLGKYQQVFRSKYNNLATFSDFSQMTNDLHQQAVQNPDMPIGGSTARQMYLNYSRLTMDPFTQVGTADNQADNQGGQGQ